MKFNFPIPKHLRFRINRLFSDDQNLRVSGFLFFGAEKSPERFGGEDVPDRFRITPTGDAILVIL